MYMGLNEDHLLMQDTAHKLVSDNPGPVTAALDRGEVKDQQR